MYILIRAIIAGAVGAVIIMAVVVAVVCGVWGYHRMKKKKYTTKYNYTNFCDLIMR